MYNATSILLNEKVFLFLIKTKMFTKKTIIKTTKKKTVNIKKYKQAFLSRGPDIIDNRFDIYILYYNNITSKIFIFYLKFNIYYLITKF